MKHKKLYGIMTDTGLLKMGMSDTPFLTHDKEVISLIADRGKYSVVECSLEIKEK